MMSEGHFSWQVQHLVMLECHFLWQARAFGDVGVSFFVAGAAFGDVGVSLFVAGAAFGEILRDSRSAKCCIFSYKMRLQSATSNLGERVGAR